jgi:hypothetical protein
MLELARLVIGCKPPVKKSLLGIDDFDISRAVKLIENHPMLKFYQQWAFR